MEQTKQQFEQDLVSRIKGAIYDGNANVNQIVQSSNGFVNTYNFGRQINGVAPVTALTIKTLVSFFPHLSADYFINGTEASMQQVPTADLPEEVQSLKEENELLRQKLQEANRRIEFLLRNALK